MFKTLQMSEGYGYIHRKTTRDGWATFFNWWEGFWYTPYHDITRDSSKIILYFTSEIGSKTLNWANII